MHSLRRWGCLLCAGLLGLGSGAVVPLPPDITPAPHIDAQRLQIRQQNPDAIDFVRVLITALPQSLRQIAATDIPAVSSILWQEFLDDNRPEWFRELPAEIQSYLIDVFGPVTAAPPESYGVPTDVPASVTNQPTGTSLGQISDTATSTLEFTSTTADSSTTTRATSTASSSQTRSTPFPSASSLSSSASQTSEFSSSTAAVPTSTLSSVPPSSTPTDPVAPASSQSGLTRNEKIGIGIGVPLGVLAIAALLFGCCFLLRRRRKRNIEGSQPPSSPGFIPRFSFQIGDADGYTERLNPHAQRYESGVGERNWDDNDNEEGYDMDTAYQGHRISPAATPMSMQDSHTPMLAPGLYHSHSSNRARGRQISHSSLQSVAEAREPDDEIVSASAESPVLGRYYHHKRGLAANRREPSIKRKPVPTPSGFDGYPGSGDNRDAMMGMGMGKREGALPAPSRPALAFPHTAAQHSGTGSSSSALAGSSMSSLSSYAYAEDYGPEYYYTGGGYNSGYEAAHHIGRGF